MGTRISIGNNRLEFRNSNFGLDPSMLASMHKKIRIVFTSLLLMFYHCSPLYYHIFQSTETKEKSLVTQFVTPFILVESERSRGSVSVGIQVIYPWGNFTDMNDGTIRFQGNAGTFGSQVYSSTNLFFAKCASGQIWENSSNTCSPAIPSTLRFCSANDNSCNDPGTLQLNGLGTSGIWSYCNGLTLAGRSWRPATKNEMKLTLFCANSPTTISDDNGSSCSSSGFKINTDLFPYDASKVCRYWTGSAFSLTDGWFINYCTGLAISSQTKSSFDYVRCVSDGP